MSYQEAINDGIRIDHNHYYPKCHFCGKEILSMSYHSNLKYTCCFCKIEMKNKKSDISNAYEYFAKEQRLENAIKRLEKISDINNYELAISLVRKNLHRDKWFESTEEVLTAIQLLRDGYKIKHQVNIGRYRVDFIIPELNVILEIDGKHFHLKQDRKKENLRDDLISLQTHNKFEIIHIYDDDLNQNITKLSSAIKEVIKKRMVIRSQYNGTLPDWYSDRNI